MSAGTSAIATALGPLVALIALGYVLRIGRFVPEAFWPQMERLVYFVLFLALLVESLASAEIAGERFFAIAVAAAIALTAMGLIAVGAGLRLGDARGRGGVIAVTVVLKLVVMPALALGTAVLFALEPLELRALVLFAALPTATSAYILARRMGGDHGLVAAILTIQTLAASLTLPALLLVLG